MSRPIHIHDLDGRRIQTCLIFFREERSDIATSAAEVNKREADAMPDLLSSTSE